MKEIIIFKDIEYKTNVFFENIILSTDEVNVRNGIIDIVNGFIDKENNEDIKLFKIIELMKLIHNYCFNFFKENNFYTLDFAYLYAYSNYPDLTEFANNKDFDLFVEIIVLKNKVVYLSRKNNSWGLFSHFQYNGIDTYEELYKKNQKDLLDISKEEDFKKLEIHFPENIKVLTDEEKIEKIINDDNLYKNYIVVKNFIQSFVNIHYVYLHLKYNIKVETKNNKTKRKMTDEEFERFFDLIKEYIHIDSKYNFKNLINGVSNNKVYFDTTNGNLTIILLTLQYKYDSISFNNIYNKDKIFTSKKFSDYKGKLKNQTIDTNRVNRKLYQSIKESEFYSKQIDYDIPESKLTKK